MKTLKMFSPSTMVQFCFAFILFFTWGCAEPDYEEMTETDSISNQEDDSWVSFLKGLEFESSIILDNQSSISDALALARPGDVIFIEPGTYNEALTIDKPDVSLIGLTGNNGEKVVLTNAGSVEVIDLHQQMVSAKAVANTEQNLKRTKKGKYFVSIKRSELCSGIAHYQFEVRLGKNEFDVVRIHRVVREHRPYRPVGTKGEIFMIHGASQDFDDIFLRPGVDKPDAQNSSPVYLASNDIDVWGIDLGWTLVPEETGDFSFMQDWGVERDVDHVLASLSIARFIRGLTRQGFGRLNLLGFSYGATVAYAATGRETQKPRIFRNVKGLIPAEGLIKYAPEDEEFRIGACNRALVAQEQINNGIYQNNNGVVFGQIGELAVSAPDEDSPIAPGLTNYQFALFAGAVPPGSPPAPFWHFVGGEFNEAKIPIGLLYTDPARWIQLLRFLAPYQPRLQGFETSTCLCDEEDSGIDRNLGEISIPILYLGVAGGFGQQGVFSSSLTKSKDITHHIVTQQPPELRAIDFGHGDLFMGEDAANLGWKVLNRWLENH